MRHLLIAIGKAALMIVVAFGTAMASGDLSIARYCIIFFGGMTMGLLVSRGL